MSRRKPDGRSIKVWLGIGSTYTNTYYADVPDEWDSWSEQERQSHLDDLANSHRDNYLDYGAALIDERVTT